MLKDTSKVFCIDLESNWSALDKISDMVHKFLDNSLTRDDYDVIKMVATELVENAIKYGYFLEEPSIRLSLEKKENRVLIEVENPIKDSELEHLQRLNSKIQWIRGYQNPFEAYVTRLKEVSNKSLRDEESGLGLARIAYEGQSILDFYVNENNLLAVSAIYEYQGLEEFNSNEPFSRET